MEHYRFRVIYSGVWLRDLSPLESVTRAVLDANPNVEFAFFVPVDRRSEPPSDLLHHPSVFCYSGLSDEALVQLYQRFDLSNLLIQLRGDEKNIIWQKERLLNIALKDLPPECDKVVW